MEIRKVVDGLDILRQYSPTAEMEIGAGVIKVPGILNLKCNEHLITLAKLGWVAGKEKDGVVDYSFGEVAPKKKKK